MAAIAQLHMNTGQKLSAGLHIGLILWVMLFDLFSSPDDAIIPEVTEVAIISAQDFAALMTPLAAPAPEPEPTPAPTPAPQAAATRQSPRLAALAPDALRRLVDACAELGLAALVEARCRRSGSNSMYR